MRRTLPFLGVVAVVLALVPSAHASSGTMHITSDTTLTEDHYGSIVIAADNVTLDCAWHNVVGPGEPDGILIDGYNGATVENCEVDYFEDYGIWVGKTTGTRLLDNTAGWNGLSGMDIVGSTDTVVRNNVMRQNGFDAGYSGIDVEYGSSDVVVSGNTSWGNAGNGFYTYQSSNLVFDNNVAFSNSQGFDLDLEVTDSTFSANRAVNNQGDGFSVVLSDDNRFIGNVVSGNGGAGFRVHRSSGNVIRSNDVRGNSADGIWLDAESDYNVVRDNDVEWNSYTGIPVTRASDWNLLAGNVSSHNGDSGIRIETSHNTLLANRASDNTNYGFWVIGSYNKLALNSGCGNGILDALQEEGTKGNVWLANNFCTSDI